MRRLKRGWRAIGASVLLALLLVPIALRGHRHAEHTATPRTCAVCLATAHTPALGAPGPVTVTPAVVRTGLAPVYAPPSARLDRPAHAGRAPPAAYVFSVA